jgi:hypothetical protein
MASESSDDGHESHPTPSLMPSLASVANEAVNFVVGLMKQPLRRNKNEAMAGSSCSSAQDVLRRGDQWNNIGFRPALINSLDDQEGGV